MGNKPLIAGNWKMNGRRADLQELRAIAGKAPAARSRDADLLICPPATLVGEAAAVLLPNVLVGGQDCHAAGSGAHTGDIAAAMLADLGATHVLVGHSERRADHGESDRAVRAKAEAAIAAGLVALVCIGESQAERDAGSTLAILGRQLAGSLPNDVDGRTVVVAYEPVWAIGTGKVPTNGDIEAAHAFIRESLVTRFGQAGTGIRILYGGSVKPSNAAEILKLAEVDGALIGGASLKAADFVAICQALPPA